MIRRDLGADRDELVLGNAEFRDLELRLDLRDRKAIALRFRNILHLGAPDSELNSRVAVLRGRAMRHDLTALDLQNGDRHMFTSVREDAGHADLLCDDT